MKYKELTVEQAREICFKQPFTKDKHKDCDHCPLRRERIDKKGKIHILFCYFILKEIIDDEDLVEEKIQHSNEL